MEVKLSSTHTLDPRDSAPAPQPIELDEIFVEILDSNCRCCTAHETQTSFFADPVVCLMVPVDALRLDDTLHLFMCPKMQRSRPCPTA